MREVKQGEFFVKRLLRFRFGFEPFFEGFRLCRLNITPDILFSIGALAKFGDDV